MTTTEEWWATNELRWQIRTINIGQYKAYLQQKWVTGTGNADDPFEVKWLDVPTVAEEE
jgi:hypothetical protein